MMRSAAWDEVRHGWFFPAAVVGMLLLYALGAPLASPAATSTACLALLLFGLPHGTLDLELLRNAGRAGPNRMAAVTALYVGLALAMYLLWQAAPIAALATFLVASVLHFSEDWDDAGSAFLAQGMSVALLAVPALFHREDMASLFVALAGRGEAATLADVLLLLAPVSLAVAAVCLFALWRSGRPERATAGIAVLAAMTLLPPAAGFALVFCFHHSPRHLRAALAALSADQFRRRWRIIAPLTAAALGLAGWLFASEARGTPSAQLVAASFMTLSVLTVPHMAAPAVAGRLFAGRAGPVSPPKEFTHADQGPSRVPTQG